MANLFVTIDRTGRFALTQLFEKADRNTAREALEHLLEVVPYRIRTILTDRAIGAPSAE
ncbi:hypothetical protein [Rhodovulum sulfidophilum]|uniref:hypothetical protein n=1 Tax=Rhodovulum sulfidophilum TaxID=35806 RepID=UPI00192396A4|nr:hypothetical protein [Rhodovulum sulfidophilum]MBL3561252.1 hypothetical protein [Rhodovulum sulfidophilum]